MAIANETVTTRSYGQILKSTALIGGSSAINIVLGILKTKVLAVLLGPAGMGLMSMYSSIMSTASSVTGVGLASSGVRQIAEAEAGNDATAIASTRAALRWATMLLAWGGAIALYLLRIPISKWIFGNSKYTGAFIWLSLGVASTTINGSQTALINGLRRIGDLARIQVLGAVVGLVVSVIIVWFWRERGIEIFVAAAALTSYLLSAYYAKKIPVIKVKLDLAIIYKELKKLFSLGLVFMLTGLMSTVVPLLTRTMVMRELGLKANGIYQAAYAIAGLYIDFILTAMGKDYYPRLTGVAHDTKAINRMVNEQTEIVLLLAAPFMILLLSFAPLIMNLLYSSQFQSASDILRWQVIGDVFKIIAWPLGYVLLAKGMGAAFFWSEFFWQALYLVFVFFGLRISPYNIRHVNNNSKALIKFVCVQLNLLVL